MRDRPRYAVKRPSRQKVLVIGIVCGLLAVVLVRVAVAVLVGGARVLAVLGAAALLWLLVRSVRNRFSPESPP